MVEVTQKFLQCTIKSGRVVHFTGVASPHIELIVEYHSTTSILFFGGFSPYEYDITNDTVVMKALKCKASAPLASGVYEAIVNVVVYYVGSLIANIHWWKFNSPCT